MKGAKHFREESSTAPPTSQIWNAAYRLIGHFQPPFLIEVANSNGWGIKQVRPTEACNKLKGQVKMLQIVGTWSLNESLSNNTTFLVDYKLVTHSL